MTKDEAANAPEGMKKVAMTGLPDLEFAMTVSVLDCTGCGSCANVCPGKKGQKALVMKPLEEKLEEQKNLIMDYLNGEPEVKRNSRRQQ